MNAQIRISILWIFDVLCYFIHGYYFNVDLLTCKILFLRENFLKCRVDYYQYPQ